MGHIYRNLKPIPVPKDCYVAKNRKRVLRYYYLNGVRKRTSQNAQDCT